MWPDEDEEQMDVDMKKWRWRDYPKNSMVEDDNSWLILFFFYTFEFNDNLINYRYTSCPAFNS